MFLEVAGYHFVVKLHKCKIFFEFHLGGERGGEQPGEQNRMKSVSSTSTGTSTLFSREEVEETLVPASKTSLSIS